MKTVSTNIDNDIYLADDGNLAMEFGLSAIGQTAIHFASTAREEMIHKFDEGIPFFQTVFARDVSIPQFEAALRRRLMRAPNVVAVVSLETIQVGEILSYTATIDTDYGRTEING